MARFVPLPAFSSTLLMPVQPRNSTVRCIFLAYFLLTTTRIAPVCGGKFETCLRFSLCSPFLRGQSILFIRLRAFCHREKSHLLWNQELLASFAKTPGVGGATTTYASQPYASLWP